MKISIITPVLNGSATVRDTIKSVLGQSHKEIEYIIVDGGSTDGTVDIVRSYGGKIAKFVTEPDKGIYDAMNKGLRLASGEIIGILNSDDIYASESTVAIAANTITEKGVDACYSDLVYVDKVDTGRIARYWKSCEYRDGLFSKGWMPPHPTFFARKRVYEQYGSFDLSLPIALDYEILFRFMKKSGIRTSYIPEPLVKMRLGGFSNKNIRNIIRQNIMIVKILRDNNISVSPFFFCAKITEKLKQFR